jgi:hypothetical protein
MSDCYMKFMRYKGTISDNTGNELVHIKRLGQIIVSAGARPAHLIADLRSGGQHYYGNRAGFPYFFEGIKSVHSRHHHIQHNQLNPRLGQCLQSILAGIINSHIYIFMADTFLQQLAQLLIIVKIKILLFISPPALPFVVIIS